MVDFKYLNNSPLEILDNQYTKANLVEEVSQKIYNRLRTFLGDWFRDSSYGVPYNNKIFTKPGVTDDQISKILRNEILKVSGIKAIIELSLLRNSGIITVSLVFSVEGSGFNSITIDL